MCSGRVQPTCAVGEFSLHVQWGNSARMLCSEGVQPACAVGEWGSLGVSPAPILGTSGQIYLCSHGK
jgi:hypothetical protein